MVNILSDIRAALETQLFSISSGIPIAFENVNFTPPDDGKYLSVKLLHAEPKNYAGIDAATQYQGLFSVIVVVPSTNTSSSGPGEAEERAASIMQGFSRGSRFVSGSTVVRISKSPWSAPAIKSDLDYSITVWVPWFCHIM